MPEMKGRERQQDAHSLQPAAPRTGRVGRGRQCQIDRRAHANVSGHRCAPPPPGSALTAWGGSCGAAILPLLGAPVCSACGWGRRLDCAGAPLAASRRLLCALASRTEPGFLRDARQMGTVCVACAVTT